MVDFQDGVDANKDKAKRTALGSCLYRGSQLSGINKKQLQARMTSRCGLPRRSGSGKDATIDGSHRC